MNIKRYIVSAMAGVSMLSSGMFPPSVSAEAAIGDGSWVDFSISVSEDVVAPDNTVEVTVMARSLGGESDIGGMVLKVTDGFVAPIEPEGLKLVEIKQNSSDYLPAKTVCYNIDVSKVLLYSGSVKLNESVPVITYVYKVPEKAIEESYIFSINHDDVDICDSNGNPVDYNTSFANAVIQIKRAESTLPKNIVLNTTVSKPSISQGDEFTVGLTMSGTGTTDVADFRLKLNIPEGIECLGLVNEKTSKGTELEFDPETLEVSTAKSDGDTVGFDWGETAVELRFKVSDLTIDGVYKIGFDDVLISDSDGAKIKTISNFIELVIGDQPAYDPIFDVKLGDADLDGAVDAKDASRVLGEYAILSTGQSGNFSTQQNNNGDVNFDGKIDSKDASRILAYYGYLSTGGKDNMDEWVKSN